MNNLGLYNSRIIAFNAIIINDDRCNQEKLLNMVLPLNKLREDNSLFWVVHLSDSNHTAKTFPNYPIHDHSDSIRSVHNFEDETI